MSQDCGQAGSLLASRPVDEFAQDVGVPTVASRLLDHMDEYPTKRSAAAVLTARMVVELGVGDDGSCPLHRFTIGRENSFGRFMILNLEVVGILG